MSHVQRFDHVGITVADLNTASALFVGLGLERRGGRIARHHRRHEQAYVKHGAC